MLQRIRQAYLAYNANWRRMPWHARALDGAVSGVAAGVIAYALVPNQPHVRDCLTSLWGHTLVVSGVFFLVQYLGYRLWLRQERQQVPPETRL